MKYLVIFISIFSLSFIHPTDESIGTIESISKNDNRNYYLYQGTINNSIPISLFLIEYPNQCNGELTYNAMYKYNNKNSGWILLNVHTNSDKTLFNMVETNFTGSLFLENNLGKLDGTWISPNTAKQFKIQLKKVYVNSTLLESLTKEYSEAYYLANDC